MNRLDLLKVYAFDNKKRYGANSDGGYVVAELNAQYDCYISAGISTEESFSRDFIAGNNLPKERNWAFDGTICDYPWNYTTDINFIKKNIANFNDDNHTNLQFLTDTHNSIFLKMDIEGGEYPWLLGIDESQLKKFTQMVIEIHGITDDNWGCSYANKIQCLEKLARTHYIVHAHGNAYSHAVNGIPDVIELTFVSKSYFESEPKLNAVSLPIPGLDYSNCENRPDYNLNFWPFVSTKEQTNIE